MGQETEILLVIAARNALILLLAGCLLVSACKKVERTTAAEQVVDAARYDAFWLWAGVKPQPVLEQAKTVYILDSEYRAATQKNFHIMRPEIPHVREADIWLVMRIETLDWEEAVYTQLLARLKRWEMQNRLVGLQIDFDADTAGLSGYAGFLRDLRDRMPPRYRLSITGLLDWSANGDLDDLAKLNGVVDEIVLQTYQGRETIAGYRDYFRRIDRLNIPFRIGLVQDGEWSAPEGLEEHPQFNGYVVFLLNRE